ncbi:MAG: sulfatase-like hydrolase/transferase, partial [Myxococcota bacterium]|nr:sulfatase-like hydrolase/transferase [Myxococcota bacterium]
LPEGGEALGRSTSESVRALDGQLPTLAEQLGDRGYQTFLVSGNPVLSAVSGLTRGFDETVIAKKFNKLHGRSLERAVGRALRRADPTRPLFLFVNIADAHQPWRRVPADVGWLPARPAFRLHASKPDGFWQGWYRGRLATSEKVDTLGHLQDVYDYGIFRADRTLGRVMARLEKTGWTEPGVRYVVTSDHGEFMGEHGLLDHGHYLEDENQRVLLLVGGDGAPELPDRVLSATEAFHLVRDGELAPGGMPVEAVTYPHRQREAWTGGVAYGRTAAARWTRGRRLLWEDDHPRIPPELAELVGRVERSGSRNGGTSEGVLEMLRAAGYVE